MATIKLVAVLPYVSGRPRDIAVNNFYFADGSADAHAMAAFWTPKVVDFYNGSDEGQSALALFYSNYIAHPSCQVVAYEEATSPTTGPPILTSGFTLGTSAASTDLPLSTALCLSYAGAPGHGVPPKRNRGRVYLGPFNASAIADTGGGEHFPKPADSLVAAAISSAHRLTAANSDENGYWSLLSRKQGSSGAAPFIRISNGWVDNEWDAQRRRDGTATVRNSWVGVG
jgi:hypothetical protein